jgi:hypothetical protein
VGANELNEFRSFFGSGPVTGQSESSFMLHRETLRERRGGREERERAHRDLNEGEESERQRCHWQSYFYFYHDSFPRSIEGVYKTISRGRRSRVNMV